MPKVRTVKRKNNNELKNLVKIPSNILLKKNDKLEFYSRLKKYLKDDIITAELLLDINKYLVKLYRIENKLLQQYKYENFFLFNKDHLHDLEACFGYNYLLIFNNIEEKKKYYKFKYIKCLDMWLLGPRFLLDNEVIGKLIFNELKELYLPNEKIVDMEIANIMLSLGHCAF